MGNSRGEQLWQSRPEGKNSMKHSINKVNPKSVMTFGIQLACICIWNRTPSVFPEKDGMPAGIFLTKLFLENEGVAVPGAHWCYEPRAGCLCCLTLQFGDLLYPCAAAEMSLWAGARVGFGMNSMINVEGESCLATLWALGE